MRPSVRLSATAIAAAVRAGTMQAEAVTRAALDRISQGDASVRAFTTVCADRALNEARAIDAMVARGEDPGPLAGAPFAVKNQFDVAGVVTRAGSPIEAENPPAAADAAAIASLRGAGAVCLGCLNMDEYAYGFTTENPHDGPTHNPHDLSRSAGGSSGGSGAAVAAGFVPLSLGSDTNGSVRVPAALCGVWGVKPTFGRVSPAGMVPFAPSLDHVGAFARSVADLAAVYDALRSPDPVDSAPIVPRLDTGVDGLRIARLGGYFAQSGLSSVQAAADRVASALGASGTIEMPHAAAARAAAFLTTAAEGAATHLDNLRARPDAFGPLCRDRLLAGALVPAQWLLQARRLRAVVFEAMVHLFTRWDLLVAPATPSPAMPLGQETLEVAGGTVPLRPAFGVYTQPISFIGLPVIAAPLRTEAGALPVGVQLIAAPWREDVLFRAAAVLEWAGVCESDVAPAFRDR